MTGISKSFDPGTAWLLDAMTEWAERGWIRRLDAALARFIALLCPSTAAPALLATALVANLEGGGHTCLLLDDFFASPERLLDWSPEALQALRVVMAELPAEPAGWLDDLGASEAVYAPGRAEQDRGEPLVLCDRRLYLRRYWGYEKQVAAQVLIRGGRLQPVDETAARVWLDRLFASERKVGGGFDWQKVACAVALRGRLSIITGGPGTGKTYTAARLLALLFATTPQPEQLRVALAAPTGKAAARLKQSIDGALHELQQRLGTSLPLRDLASQLGAARTLHSLLGARPDTRRFHHSAANPLRLDVLIVDEASMVHLEMMAALLDALPEHARVVLLGDKDQLASVEAGAVLGDLCRDAQAGRYLGETIRYVEALTGLRIDSGLADENGSTLTQQTVVLRHSQRFGGVIGDLARAVNVGDIAAATASLEAPPGGAVFWLASASPESVLDLAAAGRAGAEGGYRSYLDAMHNRPGDVNPDEHEDWVRSILQAFDRFRVLCAVRDGAWGVSGLNRAIANRLEQERLLSPGSQWYEGRPVIVNRNDYGLGVFRGDIGIALKASSPDSGLRAYFAEGSIVRSVNVGRLGDVETAFAMTVHQSQGSEFEHAALVLPPGAARVTTRELLYTGITRARSAVTLITPNRESFTEGIERTTVRSSGLRESIRLGEISQG